MNPPWPAESWPADAGRKNESAMMTSMPAKIRIETAWSDSTRASAGLKPRAEQAGGAHEEDDDHHRERRHDRQRHVHAEHARHGRILGGRADRHAERRRAEEQLEGAHQRERRGE